MLIRELKYDVKGVEEVVVVYDEQDGKTVLRERLGLKRLPNGVKTTSNREVSFEELNPKEQKMFYDAELARLGRLKAHVEKFPDMGNGWVLAVKTLSESLEKWKGML